MARVNLISLITCCILSFSLAAIINTPDVDVDFVVVGGGASGTASAVFLKDRNFSVALIEKDSQLGGACDTYYFSKANSSMAPWWIDLGVVYLTNTTWANSKGYGNWTLRTDLFAKRFVPEQSVIGVNPSQSNSFASPYVADLENPITPGLYKGIYPASDTSVDVNSVIRFITDLSTNYPWLDTVSFPAPIPPELLVPFNTWLKSHPQYEPLRYPVFSRLLYFSGLGDWDHLLAIDALQGLRPGLLKALRLTAPTENPFFNFVGGCQVLYNNILHNYLGDAASGGGSYLNSTVVSVIRPEAGQEKNQEGEINRSVVTVQRKDQHNTYQTVIRAKYVIHAVPQTPSLLKETGMSLDSTEDTLFANVTIRDYFSAAYYMEGPLTRNSNGTNLALVISNFKLTGGDLLQNNAGVLEFHRFIPNSGPLAASAWSPTPISDEDMRNIIIRQANTLKNMTANAMTYVANSPAYFTRHYYQPHFPAEELAKSPTPFQKLDAIQGRRNTYWVGAVASFAETAKVWEHAYKLINSDNFHCTIEIST